ncbi:MAG: hypothetical protein DRH08_06195 [Deltaproteobacteria bacterium]|nr:MAG: hypothetical protein DRH08_06195 [Deltaproteobacteria bacterium]
MVSANTRRNLNAHKYDLYRTHPIATRSALKAGVFAEDDVIYDPCNGLGGITDALKMAGMICHTSDKFDYDIDDTIVDFFDIEKIPKNVSAIVFNPPYKMTEEFIDNALRFCSRVIMFNRVSFLETVNRAERIQSDWSLTDIYFHSFRVGCAKGFDDDYKNAVFYAWYIFDKRKYKGVTKCHWITKR